MVRLPVCAPPRRSVAGEASQQSRGCALSARRAVACARHGSTTRNAHGPARAGVPGATVEADSGGAARPAVSQATSVVRPPPCWTGHWRSCRGCSPGHAHIIFLFALGVYLIVLPIRGACTWSARIELIGGNYTNVTSDIAASIAADLTVKIHRDRRADRKRIEQLHVASLDRLHERLDPIRGEDRRAGLTLAAAAEGLTATGLVVSREPPSPASASDSITHAPHQVPHRSGRQASAPRLTRGTGSLRPSAPRA